MKHIAMCFALAGGALACGAHAAAPRAPIRIVPPLHRAAPARPALRYGPPAMTPAVAPEATHDGLIASYMLQPNLQLGIGRYRMRGIVEPPMRPDRESQVREKGVAAIGLSLNF
jgi:hypothetical protein